MCLMTANTLSMNTGLVYLIEGKCLGTTILIFITLTLLFLKIGRKTTIIAPALVNSNKLSNPLTFFPTLRCNFD